MTEDKNAPTLRIINADATPEEIAAIVAVFAAAGSSGGAAPARRPIPEWSANHRKLRRTFPSAPGGWRSSGLPR